MRDKGILGLYEAYLEVYTHQEEVEQLDEGYQRNPEKDPDYVPPGERPTRRQRMNDPHTGINSPAFHAFMAQQTGGGKKKKKGRNENVNSSYEYDAFDAILEHLVAEGYADTNQAALAIMANMSEDWRQSIIDESILDVAAKVGKVAGRVANDVKDRVTGKKELLSGPQGYVRVGGPSKPGDVRVSGIGPVATYGRKYTPQSGDRPITVGVRR